LFGIGFFQRQMNIRLDIAGNGKELLVRGNLVFGPLTVAENALGGLLIAPEMGVGRADFERFQALAVLRGVKDSSERG
jgi:hypothetical protein